MPDTEIVVERSAANADFTIRAPLHDLAIALSAQSFDADDHIDAQEKARLEEYFQQHLAVTSADGRRYPIAIAEMRIVAASHSDVGRYQVLEVHAAASIPGNERMLFDYDGIMHRVANHQVRVASAQGGTFGIVRYSLASRDTNVIAIEPIDSSGNDAIRPAGGKDARWPVPAVIAAVLLALALFVGRRYRKRGSHSAS
jgi:hypothetical protein